MGIGLFQIGARLGYAIDLREDLVLVLQIFAGHRTESLLLALQIVVERKQVVFAGVEEIVHAFLLLGPQVELLGGLLVVPEAAGRCKRGSAMEGLTACGGAKPTAFAHAASHAHHAAPGAATALRVRL